MMRRLLAALTTALLGAGLATAPAAAGPEMTPAPVVRTISEANGWEWVSGAEAAREPVRKQDLYGCPASYVCLYKWINYNAAGGRWQAHSNVLVGACWNLENSGYTVGSEKVNNTSGSLIWNKTTLPATGVWYLEFADWAGCNLSNGYSGFLSYSYATMVPNLSTTSPEQDAGIGTNWYHRYTSVSITN